MQLIIKFLEPDNNVEPFSEFTEVKNGNDNWNNGRTYMYSGTALFQAQEGDGLQHKLSVCNDNRYVLLSVCTTVAES